MSTLSPMCMPLGSSPERWCLIEPGYAEGNCLACGIQAEIRKLFLEREASICFEAHTEALDRLLVDQKVPIPCT